MVLWQRTGDMQAGLETFNQQPCSPESCHSVTLAKVFLFGKAAPFFAKKGHCSNLIFGAEHIGFFGLQEVVLPSIVNKDLPWTQWYNVAKYANCYPVR